ncbi:caprin-2-like [Mercenaria mercenaria]|uniref:caprin-2-like n=1 Tax=Mercenaria mercenaria TaxID=6596 RepID=UPI00234FAEB2|nr:caprin-2-like [Mercenaria mercenaria]
MKEEMIELKAELNHLKQYKTKDKDGCNGIGLDVHADENRTNIPAENKKRNVMTQLNKKQIPTSGGNKRVQKRKLKSNQAIHNENTDMPDSTHISSRNVGEQNGTVTIIDFHAIVQKSEGIHRLGRDQTIVFETVRLNLDGGYNSNTGIFTAPIGGLYLFSVSIVSGVDPKPLFYVGLVKNGAWLASACGHGGSGKQDQGSVTVAMQLNAGD